MSGINPKPDGERIKRLMERVENGDIKIPKFQRQFVWKQKDVIDLLDSLFKGFPIGSLLFWRTMTKINGEKNIGGYNLTNTPESYPTNYVLDGQQRLTTIFSIFNNKVDLPGIEEVLKLALILLAIVLSLLSRPEQTQYHLTYFLITFCLDLILENLTLSLRIGQLNFRKYL